MKVTAAASAVYGLNPQPNLVIDYTTSTINSYAAASNEVHIFMYLAELISDSESEPAFVVGHEVGHIVQYQKQQLIYVPTNR